jgi:thiosulfate/3-mercaptopyruvate sulfurtransferase
MSSPLVSVGVLAAHLNDPNWIVFDCRHDLANTEYGAQAPARCSCIATVTSPGR